MFCNVTTNPKSQSTPQYEKACRPKCSALTTIINIRFVFILGISTGNSNRIWKITGSLEEALDVVKKHEIEETVRFRTYSSTKKFGVTGKKQFDYVM